MSAIQILVDEHEQIMSVIGCTETILNTPALLEDLPVEDVKNILDFVQHFADKYHHMKEEDLLFAEMVKNGMSTQSGPIAVMLHEHNLGRNYIQQALLALKSFEDGNREAIDALRENLLKYCELLSNHIAKENNILYPMAERILSADTLNNMERIFAETNASTPNNEYTDKYLKLAKMLSMKYN